MIEKLPMSDRLLEMVAQRFKLLSEPTRLRILQLLLDGERTVGDLVEAMGANQANVSHQLNILADGGLVARRRNGTNMLYHIDDPSVRMLSDLVCRSLQAREEADLCLLKSDA